MSSGQELLRLEKIRKRYANHHQPVLEDLSLGINQGDVISIQGASGSGKTTLLQIMGMLLNPDAGKVFFRGEETGEWREGRRTQWRNRQVGFVFQLPYLIPELTVLENVIIPARIGGMAHPQKHGLDLLDRVGLASRAADYPQRLSGGEQQRVGIARAMINHPALILADEPTGSLHPSLAQEIMKLLLSFQQEYATALVVVTHNPELVDQLGGRSYWLNDGQLHIVLAKGGSAWDLENKKYGC